ncbi:MAG TPA: regulatory iron-sulfur-containing complex subunit RicT [Candidatus Cloacimonadota bacterium]|nr:regulatory iron-sulfur-containing complex subunit RicT [Candidatus Cloacimonadota bacterium]HPT71098.1 regulatory iron-sulfur-containing complex subunit RicT [Candidatus Cloacimonadota bacterium]
MQECIEVEFRSGRLGYYTNPNEIQLNPDDVVILEVERGEDIATVVHLAMSNPDIEALCDSGKVYKIKRIATEEDLEKLNNIIEKENSATDTFLGCVGKYDFEMKLIETIYQFDGNKLTFFFTADGRIDFRQFVRELANIFRTRIELHQTTGRDEAKRLGGFGMCGNKYCCTSYMKRFNQVTIKMAKDQNLAGNLSKISGPCGRLLCCLHFEEDYYVETARDFPEMGESVQIKGVTMYVFKNDFYNKKVYLSSDDQVIDTMDLEEYNQLKANQKH